jgi:Na+-driven multidrug efflux pump
MFLGSNEDINLVASTGYYGAFYSILMQAFNFGAIEVQGIFGSQANGNKDPLRVNQLFRQSIATGIIFYLVFTCIPAYFIEALFPFLGVDDDLGNVVKALIWWSIPAMFVRVLNDNFKTFL